jgi:hypothetical protein
MENQSAGVAESGRRKGLKISGDTKELLEKIGTTWGSADIKNGSVSQDLETRQRLVSALHDAGTSALGFPGTVDTFLPWLKRHGLQLTLAPAKDPCPHDHETHRFADDGGRV